MFNMMTAIGLMSGTSLDGIDAAMIRTDGERELQLTKHFLTMPYEKELRQELREAIKQKHKFPFNRLVAVEKHMTLAHVDVVKRLIKDAGLTNKDINVIGFHGQTISHDPEYYSTWQIGDAPLLVHHTGIDVINDFRTNDVREGGQGAPLVPLYHRALLRRFDKSLPRPIAVLNLGGVANITYLGRSHLLSLEVSDLRAFDTGPGNALIDDWVYQRTGRSHDYDGELAAKGKVIKKIVDDFLSDEFFEKKPPKSLDRNHFSLDALKGLSLENGAATLVAFTVESVVQACQHLPRTPKQWLVTGGGRHNKHMMKRLSARLPGRVDSIDAIGVNGDAIEAQAFAYLAVRSFHGLHLTLPTTTGVTSSVTGGVFYPALSGRVF